MIHYQNQNVKSNYYIDDEIKNEKITNIIENMKYNINLEEISLYCII